MEFIVSIASSIVNCVVPCISSQIDYIRSYKKKFEKLESEVQRLEDTKVSMQHRVDEAERNGENIEEIVQNWLKEANDTVAKVKKLIDVEAGCCRRQCLNPWTRNRLSRKFEEMTREISHVIANGNFNIVSYRVAPEVTISPFCRGYEALESRTSMLNQIKEALKDPKFYMIGVHGMGGVGKTTLVNELAWQVKKDGSFGAVVIATITLSPIVEKIQDQIADALLDGKLGKTTKEGRAGALRSHPTYAVQRYTKMKEWPKVDQLQKCHYIIIPWSYIDELPEKLECPELKLLSIENIGYYKLRVPDNFFSGMREVRTLHLYGMAFTSSLVLSLHLLINLRTLNLYNFEDLSFAKLKHVKDVLYELDEEGFPQLKNLHIQDSDELLHIINLRGLVIPHSAFPNLETLVLHSLNNMEEICHGPLPTQSFAKLKVVMSKLETLKLYHLHACKIWDDKFLARALVKLQRLHISKCSMLKEIFVQEEGEVQFPNLETLDISSMDDLKSIWPNQLAPNSFGKLKGIHIGDCKSLDYVFPISVAKELRQLQSLEINELRKCSIQSSGVHIEVRQ
ncbi:disease resistance protein [Spatholobus suberectus]|nr:disease resistance protein [Spatholobus suberectus]